MLMKKFLAWAERRAVRSRYTTYDLHRRLCASPAYVRLWAED